MAVVLPQSDPDLFRTLLNFDLADKLVVSATDTVYGIAASIHSSSALTRLRALKARDERFLILIGSLEQAHTVALISPTIEDILRKYWPGAISFVLPDRTGGTVALRQPQSTFLTTLLSAFASPIYSTSCNPAGQSTATTVAEARAYFGDAIDLYIDGGTIVQHPPSTLVDLTQSPYRILREGSVKFLLK